MSDDVKGWGGMGLNGGSAVRPPGQGKQIPQRRNATYIAKNCGHTIGKRAVRLVAVKCDKLTAALMSA